MDDLESIEQDILNSQIDYGYANLRNFDAITIKYNDNVGIYLNSNKKYSRKVSAYLLGHEKAHLDSSSLYGLNDTSRRIKARERKAMNKHILSCPRFNQEQIKKDLECGLQVYEIADKYNVCDEMIKDAIVVFKSKFWDK